MDKGKDTIVQTAKDVYREKIVEMIGQIENLKILRCIYIFVSDIMKETESDFRKEENQNGQSKN